MTSALPLWTISGPAFGSWKWLRVWSLIVLLSVCLILLGCSFASFVSAAEADVPVVIQMVSNITNIVAPGVSAALQAAGALAMIALTIACGMPAPGATKCDPTSLIGQYQATPTATILAKIQSALSTTNGHIMEMLALAQGLPAGISAAIVAAVGVALATINALMGMLPAATAYMAGNLKLAKKIVDASQPQKPGKIKAAFNEAIGAKYPAAVI